MRDMSYSDLRAYGQHEWAKAELRRRKKAHFTLLAKGWARKHEPQRFLAGERVKTPFGKVTC